MPHIDIVLSLTSPLYVAYPDNLDKANNISRTTKQPLMIDGRMQGIPYYPANGFRGGLRRKAMGRLVKHLKASEGPVSGDLYLGLSCGAASGSPDQSPLTIEEILRARNNVYMGLFGGGARLHQSSYRVSDMLPILADTVASGAIPERCKQVIKAKPLKEGQGSPEYLKGNEITGSRTSIRVDDLYRVMNPAEILANVASPVESIAKHQNAVLANREGRKQDSEETKADVANMMGIETIAAGTPFFFRVDFDHDVDAAKVGLILLCLNDLFVENAFGGWTRCGFGKVRVDQIAVGFDGDTHLWDSLHDTAGTFALPAAAEPFTSAANAAIEALRIADMAGFFEDFSADAKAKKKAEAKAKKEAKGA